MICGKMYEYDSPICKEAADCLNPECLYPFSAAGKALAEKERIFWKSPEGKKRLQEQRGQRDS